MSFGVAASLRIVASGLQVAGAAVEAVAAAAEALGDPAISTPGAVIAALLVARGRLFEAACVVVGFSLWEISTSVPTGASFGERQA